MSQTYAPNQLWHVLQAQADDMFALYQLAQLLGQSTQVDEIVRLALPELVRISDGAYAALFLPDVDGRLDLIAFIGPDAEDGEAAHHLLEFGEQAQALAWFAAASGLDSGMAPGCLSLPLDLGSESSGLLALAAPNREGFSHHEQHLLATMVREVERALQLAMAHSDLRYRQQQVERMKTDFVAAVSHDLRTPLALIQAGVDSLTHLQLTPEQQQRFIADIGQAAAQLTHQVDTILRFSALEEGRPNLRLQKTDLAEIVAQTIRQWGPAQQRIQLQVPAIAVDADSDALRQIITNVIANALKYSPDGSPVRVRGRMWPEHEGPEGAPRPAERRPRVGDAPAGIAWLEIRDWGAGVPAEDLPYVFTKFFRAANARESGKGGTGLGLHIANRLVEAQGGSMRLRSRLGQGTTVRICLPLRRGVLQPPAESTGQE